MIIPPNAQYHTFEVVNPLTATGDTDVTRCVANIRGYANWMLVSVTGNITITNPTDEDCLCVFIEDSSDQALIMLAALSSTLVTGEFEGNQLSFSFGINYPNNLYVDTVKYEDAFLSAPLPAIPHFVDAQIQFSSVVDQLTGNGYAVNELRFVVAYW